MTARTFENRLAKIEDGILVLKWLVGINLVLTFAMLAKVIIA